MLDHVNVIKSGNVTMKHFAAVLQSQKFLAWSDAMATNTRLKVSDVLIKDVFMFGSAVGFVTLIVTAKNKETQKPVPGYVFLRGDATAVLTLIREMETDALWTVLVEQDRVPIARACRELPAGMLDENSCVRSVALKELQEETGLDASKACVKFTPLGDFWPSAGGCDEQLHCGYVLFDMKRDDIKALHGRMHGEMGTSESTKLHVVPFTVKDMLATGDAKAICATLAFMDRQALLPKNQLRAKLTGSGKD